MADGGSMTQTMDPTRFADLLIAPQQSRRALPVAGSAALPASPQQPPAPNLPPPVPAPPPPAAGPAAATVPLPTAPQSAFGPLPDAPLPAFGPLPASLPQDSALLETLAPTTPTESTPSVGDAVADEASQEDIAFTEGVDTLDTSVDGADGAAEAPKASQGLPVAAAAPVDTQSAGSGTEMQVAGDPKPPALDYSPFGLAGFARAFPMGGPDSAARVYSKQQLGGQLKALGLSGKDAISGFHVVPGGGAVVVQPVEGYRLQRLDEKCVRALEAAEHEAFQRFAAAARAVQHSQEISNLDALSAAAEALRQSPLASCSDGDALTNRLKILQKSCESWSAARTKVARLLHQKKSRELQLQNLRQQLSTATDVLAKDQEAVQAASAAEKQVAQRKRGLVLGLAAEMEQEVKGLEKLQKTVLRAR